MVDLAGPACSDWRRSQDLDPVGTAGAYQGFLLVETPLPWPSDITDLPELAEVSTLAAAAGARVQAVFPSLWPEGSRHPGPRQTGPVPKAAGKAGDDWCTTARLGPVGPHPLSGPRPTWPRPN